MKDKTDVCVLGAGVSGLSAALIVARHNQDVIVLEKDGCVGGLSRTVQKDGFRFDLGGHRFFTRDAAVNAFFQAVIGEELVWVNRRSRIYHNGEYFPYPLELMETLRNVGPWMGIKMVGSYIHARTLNSISGRPVISVEDWLVNKFGRVLYETFFKTYTEKVWGISCAQMSQDWACQRIREMSLVEAIKSIFFKKSRRKLATLIDRFMYPDLGIGRLSERLVDYIGQERVWLGSEITGIYLHDNRIRQIAFRRDDGDHVIHVQNVIASIPLTQLIRLITPPPSMEVLTAAQKLRYRNLVTVSVFINREKVTEDTWLYIQDPRVKMSRLHETRNWSTKMVPPGKTCLVVEYPCFEDDEIWHSSDDQIIQQTLIELDTLKLFPIQEVISGLVVRVPMAYPIYHIGYEASRRVIKDYLHRIPNMQIIGRNGMHRYHNIDHCIETGLKAASNILGTNYNLELVNAEPSYLEENPVQSSESTEWSSQSFEFSPPVG